MKQVWLGTVALVGLLLGMSHASSQPPGRGRGPGGRNGGPHRFELGRVLPPPLVEELELTTEQQAEIARLEKEVRERLTKILTAEQRRKAEAFRPHGPGGPPPGPFPPPREDNRDAPPRRERPARPDEPAREQAKNTTGGIQWYATWKSGLKEAQRSGRPILLVSAAPHCAGVSGIW